MFDVFRASSSNVLPTCSVVIEGIVSLVIVSSAGTCCIDMFVILAKLLQEGFGVTNAKLYLGKKEQHKKAK